MSGFSLGLVSGLRSRLRSGKIPDLLPRLLCRPRQERTVLEALAEVGPAGMTPNSLEVTTELPRPRLEAALQPLLADGLVCRWERPAIEPGSGGLTDPQDRIYLLAEYVLTGPDR